MHINNPTNSEVDAYTYIKEQLELLGWVVKNPARVLEGEVYKQNEPLSNKYLKKALIRDMPEAVIKLADFEYWVIESKRDLKDIDQALDEAKNQYAKKINSSQDIKCILISGVAGNDTDGYIVKNQYFKEGKWIEVLFNGKTKNILLSKEQATYILEHDTFNWSDLPDTPEGKYISSAIDINDNLHNSGINKNKRARFIAGLVLSMSLNTPINMREEDTTTLVNSVNNLIAKKLREVGKENFFDFLKLELPPTTENHIKYRDAIKHTIKELNSLDIKNAMASGKDVLGEFYEKFLKYGNGAKEIGIVLTPRHITEFAVEVLGITHKDYVFDPTCGTAGFLVSAFDSIKKTATSKQIDKFKTYNIFGVEQDDEVVALALVNMIFRGDGRNNMSEGNCFQKNINKTNKDSNETGKFEKRLQTIIENGKEKITIVKCNNPIITKVLMNPPFALKKGDEKERHFIDYALSQMEDGGLLFAIVPISIMVEGGKGKNWRKSLLNNNTLLSVVTLPEDLFYPVMVGTIGVFIKKGMPHNFTNQNVYFARAVTDGLVKKKGKRIKSSKEKNQLSEVTQDLIIFLSNNNFSINNIPEFKTICKLDPNDTNYELVPEIYIESRIPNVVDIEKELDISVKEALTYLVKQKRWRENHITKQEGNIKLVPIIYIPEKQEKGLCCLSKKTALPKNQLDKGVVPYVTTSSFNNGVTGFFDLEANFKGKCLTVALNGSVGETFFQFDDFITSGDNAVLTLKQEYNPCLLFYISVMIKNHQWRYNYYRKLNLGKLNKMQIPMPFKNNKLDLEYIENIVSNSYGFDELKEFL
jgi:type I restriction-modification system DNA methylase subunit